MQRRMTSENEPADWFLLAADRLRSADAVWSSEGLTMSGVELLQEAAERFVKGFLVSRGWRVERTHDLVHLMKTAASHDARFAAFADLSATLTQEFFAQHYPGGDLTDVGQDYESTRRQLGELVALIRDVTPDHSTDLPADSSA